MRHFYYFLFSFVELLGFSNAHSQIESISKMPEEIVMYANDIELLTTFTITPTIFDNQIILEKISPIRIKDTSVIKTIINTLTMDAVECKNGSIDTRGLLVFKYDKTPDVNVYYNMSYILLNKKIYQIPISFPYYLDSIRAEAIKEE